MTLTVKDANNWILLKNALNKLLDSQNYSESFLKRRISSRLRALQLDTYSEYYKVLSRDNLEKKRLKEELSISVTEFFRDSPVYELIRAEIIPCIIHNKKKDNDSDLVIWSAGCCTGEEPYSIAILLKELLGKKFSEFNVNILATDIDPDSIEAAKQGEYLKKKVKSVNKFLLGKYFNKFGEGLNEKYILRDEIKSLVTFKVRDLFSFIRPRKVDLILCRNTVIYFDEKIKEKLYLTFFDSLRDYAFFVMGKTETLRGPATDKFKIYNTKERVYIKNQKEST